MRRFAIFSDVHGNIRALDAVLGDLDAAGIAERYCLGDLVGYGAEPGEVVARVRELGIPTVCGNYDQGVGDRSGSCGCYYATPEARADGAASYEFTARVLSDADKDWLIALPSQIAFDAEGIRVLLAHGSPRKVNEYLMPDRTDEFLGRLAEQAEADLVCVGHVHVPYHRVVRTPAGRRAHWVSSGSVGKPKDGDPRACWVEVVIGSAEEVDTAAPNDESAECAGSVWVGAVVHRVAYDVLGASAAVLAAGLPPRLAEALVTA